MIQTIKYNEKRDKDIVRSGLAIDINTAIDTGSVNDSGVDVEYQGGEDYSLDQVGKRIDDPFSAMDDQRRLFARERAKGKVVSDVKPSGGEAD